MATEVTCARCGREARPGERHRVWLYEFTPCRRGWVHNTVKLCNAARCQAQRQEAWHQGLSQLIWEMMADGN